MQIGKPKKVFTFSTESLGDLDCIPKIYWSDKELKNRLGKDIKDANPDDFLRALISVSCQKAPQENAESPSVPASKIQYADVAGLKESELEYFAQKYVETNRYLNCKLNAYPQKDGDGTVFETEYGEVEHPKLENETNRAYLYRLSVLKEKEDFERSATLSEKYARLSAPFPGFSDKLKLQMERTLSMGDKLQETIQRMTGGTVSPRFENTPAVDYREITERAARPYRELSERLDELISLSEENTSLSAKEGELLVDMNQTQTGIASELKNSGDINVSFARKNFYLSILVAVLSASSLLIAIWTVYSGSNSSKELSQNLNKYTAGIEKNLGASNAESIQATNNNSAALNELIKQQKEMLSELKSIKTAIEKKPESTNKPEPPRQTAKTKKQTASKNDAKAAGTKQTTDQ